MAENAVDQIFAQLRGTLAEYYPHLGVCRAIRLVGHTPKVSHYTYEAVAEFTHGQVRIACKVYRGRTAKDNPKTHAAR
ncbi:MAG: hypothetical protein JOZ43_05900, partial [Acidobacteriales bacterium]|nr:hypothetical protein [Terriglobales bacterium]